MMDLDVSYVNGLALAKVKALNVIWDISILPLSLETFARDVACDTAEIFKMIFNIYLAEYSFLEERFWI